jgi:hypothetical protein
MSKGLGFVTGGRITVGHTLMSWTTSAPYVKVNSSAFFHISCDSSLRYRLEDNGSRPLTILSVRFQLSSYQVSCQDVIPGRTENRILRLEDSQAEGVNSLL